MSCDIYSSCGSSKIHYSGWFTIVVCSSSTGVCCVSDQTMDIISASKMHTHLYLHTVHCSTRVVI